jgi:hypothetical protein
MALQGGLKRPLGRLAEICQGGASSTACARVAGAGTISGPLPNPIHPDRDAGHVRSLDRLGGSFRQARRHHFAVLRVGVGRGVSSTRRTSEPNVNRRLCRARPSWDTKQMV